MPTTIQVFQFYIDTQLHRYKTAAARGAQQVQLLYFCFLCLVKQIPQCGLLLLLLLMLMLLLLFLNHWGGSTFFRNAPTSAISCGTA